MQGQTRRLSEERKSDMLHRKRTSRRLSVWGLILALTVCFCSFAAILPVQGKTMWAPADGARELTSDVGDAVSDVGDAVSEALTDMLEGDQGLVSDDDGIIGNESEEATDTEAVTEDESNVGWIGVAIALAVAAVIIILIIVLIPKKKK